MIQKFANVMDATESLHRSLRCSSIWSRAVVSPASVSTISINSPWNVIKTKNIQPISTTNTPISALAARRNSRLFLVSSSMQRLFRFARNIRSFPNALQNWSDSSNKVSDGSRSPGKQRRKRRKNPRDQKTQKKSKGSLRTN